MKLPGIRALWSATLKMTRTHGRLVARLLIGALGSYLIAQWCGLAQSFWSVITALVVIQASVGGTLNAGIDRIVGTVVGAITGAVVGLLHPLGVPDGLVLLFALTPLAFVAAVRPAYRIAPITAVIVLLGGTEFHPFWLGAAYRIAEIFLGTVVGVVVSLIVLPSHAHESIRRNCARALGPLADLLEVFLTQRGNFRQDRVNLLNDQVRSAITQAEKMVQESRREPGARNLGSGVELRALRRIHSDVVFVGRATYDWPAEASWPELDAAIDNLEHVLRAALDGLAAALRQGGSTAAVDRIDGAIGRLIDVLEHSPAPLSQKLGVLPFTIQTLRRDMSDFADILTPENDTTR